MSRTAIAIALLGSLAAAAACGDDGGGPTGGIDISGLTFKPCEPAARLGGFEVALTPEFTAVQGQVYDSVLPALIPTTITTVGACKLVSSPNHTCTPACPASQVCNASQTCVAFPVAGSVGTVAVAGMLATVEMPARSPTFFYSSTATLPNPGYELGTGLELTAAGAGAFGSFRLLGFGVEALALTATTYTVERDKDLVLGWTPPSRTGPAKVAIALNINGHGLVGSRVECVVDDTGSYTIPAALITQLVDAGTSGFPTVSLSRTSIDSTAVGPGCVDFRVHSSVKVDVTIPGVQSCNDDDDCTPPETCQGDLTCG